MTMKLGQEILYLSNADIAVSGTTLATVEAAVRGGAGEGLRGLRRGRGSVARIRLSRAQLRRPLQSLRQSVAPQRQ